MCGSRAGSVLAPRSLLRSRAPRAGAHPAPLRLSSGALARPPARSPAGALTLRRSLGVLPRAAPPSRPRGRQLGVPTPPAEPTCEREASGN